MEDRHGQINTAAIYCPPRFPNKSRLDQLDQFTRFFKTLGNKFIVGGDFNAKHTRLASRLIFPRGRELSKCMDNNNY